MSIDDADFTRLHATAAEGDVHALLRLLAQGDDVNETECFSGVTGTTAMMIAAGAGHPGCASCITLLAEKGGDVNAADAKGTTALIAAARPPPRCIIHAYLAGEVVFTAGIVV